MLVISRCADNGIRIGNDVLVKVLKVGQRRVTLGIDAPSEVTVVREEAAGEARSATARGKALRVLVVEDIPEHALLIQRTLSGRGFSNIVRTASGEDAIRLLSMAQTNAQLRPDLVILDIQLPGISGFQVLETIKTIQALTSIPVVMLTFTDEDATVSKCLDAGANAYLLKSEDAAEFRKALLRIVDFWGFRRTLRAAPRRQLQEI
jgi:carbon storage regulator CsrA